MFPSLLQVVAPKAVDVCFFSLNQVKKCVMKEKQAKKHQEARKRCVNGLKVTGQLIHMLPPCVMKNT